LGLDGVAELGRWDPAALSGATLVGVECRHGRVEATYAPPGWGVMTVRAAWAPSGDEDEGVDLEIQLGARSVDELHAVEVRLVSTLQAALAPPGLGLVEPRDARSAGLTYDGREPDLSGLTTRPPRAPRPVWLASPPGEPTALRYLEMVHPDDLSRRILTGDLPRTLRTALFGYDLERGVILRGRLRGLWLPGEADDAEVARRFDQFLHEPLPLAT
jgi:hypothetical protein